MLLLTNSMNSQAAFEEHEETNYRQQVFNGDLPRSAGNMSKEEYTWGKLSLPQRVSLLLPTAQSQSELGTKLALLDPLKDRSTDEDSAVSGLKLIQELLTAADIPLIDSPPYNYGLIEFDAESFQEGKEERRTAWVGLNILQQDAKSARQTTRNEQGEDAVKACFTRKGEKAFNAQFMFCYRCGLQIVYGCRCSGNHNKLIFPSKLPRPLGPEATIADHAAWHSRLLTKTEYSTCCCHDVSRWWADELPIIAVILLRYGTVLLEAIQQYVSRMDFKDAAARVQHDLGCQGGFTHFLKPIGITKQVQVKAYAVTGVRKLTQYQFAQLSLAELWLCNEAWDLAKAEGKMPQAAVEGLLHLRGFLFKLLINMFTVPFLAPDFRGIADDREVFNM